MAVTTDAVATLVRQMDSSMVETEDFRLSYRQLKMQVEELQLELLQKEEQFERRKRLAALGELAAGVAHEIRNPLGGINLYVDLLKKDVQGDEEKLRLVEHVQNGIVTLNGLVEDMLEFAKPREVNKSPCDLGDMIAAALGMIEHVVEERDIHVHNGCRGLIVPMDPNVMMRAFANLIMNAFQAMGEEGVLSIEAGEAELLGVAAITIRFTDTGPGIPRDVAEKVFDPFFTLREEGTGLGLSIVHRAVESHGGTVEAGCARGGGAVLCVTIPRE